MKKLISLGLLVLFAVAIAAPCFASAAQKAVNKDYMKALIERKFKVTIADPIYCKISKAELDQARKEAKDKKIAKK
jgi:disulfide oxidoreductase YuzD